MPPPGDRMTLHFHLVLLAACTAPPKPDSPSGWDTATLGAILDPLDWHAVAPGFGPDGGALDCNQAGIRVEEDVLELDTGACSTLIATQPLLSDLSQDEPLSLLAWHTALAAPEPALGSMKVYLGDSLLWSVQRPIPAPPAVYPVEHLRAPELPAGTPIYVLVRNHGANNWRFAWLRRES